jgi:hypothetical protein
MSVDRLRKIRRLRKSGAHQNDGRAVLHSAVVNPEQGKEPREKRETRCAP